MSEKPVILVVDDDPVMQQIYAAALAGSYRIVTAASGENALLAAQDERPDVILLDVEMPPGPDGYETCRRFREIEATAATPVVFVSGHDLIEDRLKGYDAGGNDYVTKPVDPQELNAKVAHQLRTIAAQASLKEMANYATSTAMTAMTSMSEMGALLESLRNFNACSDCAGLADAALAGLALFGMQGAVQIRLPQGSLTRTHHGEASPLEESVISHMAGMERIVQFKSRMSITYDHVSLLVNDMPLADPERCGRLRDHLAMLVEGAEVRARGILEEMESARRGAAIERAAKRITETLGSIDAAQRQSLVQTRMAVTKLTDEIDKALLSVALTEAQDEFLSSIFRSGIDRIIDDQSVGIDVQNQLTTLIAEMRGLSATA